MITHAYCTPLTPSHYLWLQIRINLFNKSSHTTTSQQGQAKGASTQQAEHLITASSRLVSSIDDETWSDSLEAVCSPHAVFGLRVSPDSDASVSSCWRMTETHFSSFHLRASLRTGIISALTSLAQSSLCSPVAAFCYCFFHSNQHEYALNLLETWDHCQRHGRFHFLRACIADKGQGSIL